VVEPSTPPPEVEGSIRGDNGGENKSCG